MELYYNWAERNNMEYNGSKFVVLRYGQNDQIKNDTTYFSNNMNDVICPQEEHKDLGIKMSDSGNFEAHISGIIKKARQKIGWLCRSFRSRDINFMRKMYITYVRPQLEYCSVLWGPNEGPLMDKIEKVQSDYTKLVPALKSKSYSERLKIFKLTSMERRFDRYKIFYIRKILLGLVPNMGIKIRRSENHRNGTFLEQYDFGKKIRNQSFLSVGPRIYNVLPQELRALNDSMSAFKEKFDQFLSIIPDRPRIDEGSKMYSNSLDKAIKEWNQKFVYSHV